MNRNLILAALPFAGIADVALMVKAFAGYSDPTLTVVAVGSVVITALLVLKAFGHLGLPSFSCQRPQEVHNHYHYDRNDEHCDDGCDDDNDDDNSYSEEALADAREEGREEGYDDGYESGQQDGYSEKDLADAREEGRVEGYNDGYESGHQDGYDAGFAEAGEDSSDVCSSCEDEQELAHEVVAEVNADKVDTEAPTQQPLPGTEA